MSSNQEVQEPRSSIPVHTVPGNPPGHGRWTGLTALLPGLMLAVAIAAVATVVGRRFPLVGGPVTGIVIGVVLATLMPPGGRLRPGIAVASKTVLQASVVVLGSQLSLMQIVRVGVGSMPVMLGTLTVALVAAYWIGRWLGVIGNLRTLIGVGTGICGASAIAAVTPVIGAVGAEVTYAISTIFLFNVSAVLLFPTIGHLLGMSQHAFGLFAGTAVNDMSSVVATATTFGAEAANYAVVVKLTRTLLIIPICLGLAALTARNERRAAARVLVASDVEAIRPPRVRVWRLVPPFLIGFLIVAAANTLGLIPTALHPALSQVSVFLITVALTAIGLSTDLAGLRRAGHRPLLLGASLWVVVSLASLGLQRLTGTI
ncbi:MAG: YeiH family protein [Cellulomonas sp.]